MKKSFKVKNIGFGSKYPLTLISGPCVIESKQKTINIAEKLCNFSKKNNVPLVFKASYDKANRTSISSFRGLGIKKGLEILLEIKEKFDIPILTDVHSVEEVEYVSKLIDIIQIPAFLSRQTDLLLAAGNSGCAINIKKAQFLSPWDIKYVIEKIESTKNTKIIITERGSSFGYNTLVADMRSLVIMKKYGYPIIFDATHSVQSPGGNGSSSGGDGEYAPYLAKAAAAVGVNGFFIETHSNPKQSLSDGENMIPLKTLPLLWKKIVSIDKIK